MRTQRSFGSWQEQEQLQAQTHSTRQAQVKGHLCNRQHRLGRLGGVSPKDKCPKNQQMNVSDPFEWKRNCDLWPFPTGKIRISGQLCHGQTPKTWVKVLLLLAETFLAEQTQDDIHPYKPRLRCFDYGRQRNEEAFKSAPAKGACKRARDAAHGTWHSPGLHSACQHVAGKLGTLWGTHLRNRYEAHRLEGSLVLTHTYRYTTSTGT